jgi:hypothetical protein
MAFVYEANIIASKQFSATTFTFKVWELYSDFNYGQPSLLVRASLNDPTQILPSQASITLTLNFPPTIGNVTLVPTSGQAIATNFKITASGFTDPD